MDVLGDPGDVPYLTDYPIPTCLEGGLAQKAYMHSVWV